MQSKGFIKLIAVLLALACVYQLSFTFKTRNVEKKAVEYAAAFPLEQQAEAEKSADEKPAEGQTEPPQDAE